MKCAICAEEEAKYKCPRCMVQTCSLKCVKVHKSSTSCNGVREKTAYVKVKEFNDINLLSDYRFLEDAGRTTSNARRDKLKELRKRSKYLTGLVKEATKRQIDLRLMPAVMSKRKKNSTMYNHRLKQILWMIEWIFPQAEAKYISRRLPDASILGDLLQEQFLDPKTSDPVHRQKLWAYCKAGIQGCSLLMKVEGLSNESVRYHKLNPLLSISENLRGKCIIEYPTIHVVLHSHCRDYTIEENHTDTRIKEVQSSAPKQETQSTSQECQQIKSPMSNTSIPKIVELTSQEDQ